MQFLVTAKKMLNNPKNLFPSRIPHLEDIRAFRSLCGQKSTYQKGTIPFSEKGHYFEQNYCISETLIALFMQLFKAE